MGEAQVVVAKLSCDQVVFGALASLHQYGSIDIAAAQQLAAHGFARRNDYDDSSFVLLATNRGTVMRYGMGFAQSTNPCFACVPQSWGREQSRHRGCVDSSNPFSYAWHAN